MASAFEHDLDSVKVSQRSKYLGQMSFHSEVIVRTQSDTQTHTHRAECSTWTTSVTVSNEHDEMYLLTYRRDMT